MKPAVVWQSLSKFHMFTFVSYTIPFIVFSINGGANKTWRFLVGEHKRGQLTKDEGVHSTSWKFSTLSKFSLHIAYIFKKAWKFLTKFWYSDQMFRRNIFTHMCLKSELSVHTQLAITLLYKLFANILTCCQLETYIEDTPWKTVSQDDAMNMVLWLFFELCTMCTTS